MRRGEGSEEDTPSRGENDESELTCALSRRLAEGGDDTSSGDGASFRVGPAMRCARGVDGVWTL